MDRRQALKLCLAFPATTPFALVEEKQTPTGPITVLSNKTRLQLNLTDAEGDLAGVTGMSVLYKGEKIEVSAKEIWDALQVKP